MKDRKCPDLVEMMAKDVNLMDAADLVFSYVVAAYLLEAQADKAPDLLRAIGEKKVPFHEAVPQALGIDVRTLQERVEKWLGARR